VLLHLIFFPVFGQSLCYRLARHVIMNSRISEGENEHEQERRICRFAGKRGPCRRCAVCRAAVLQRPPLPSVWRLQRTATQNRPAVFRLPERRRGHCVLHQEGIRGQFGEERIERSLPPSADRPVRLWMPTFFPASGRECGRYFRRHAVQGRLTTFATDVLVISVPF